MALIFIVATAAFMLFTNHFLPNLLDAIQQWTSRWITKRVKATGATILVAAAIAAGAIQQEPNEAYPKGRQSYLYWMSQRAADAMRPLWTAIDKAVMNLHTQRERLPHEYTHRPTVHKSQFRSSWSRALIVSLVAMSSHEQAKYYEEGGPFDTDSALVGIDNRCSGCISHKREDFPGDVVECHRTIKGFGGTRHFKVWTGTIRWTWDDDEGKQHTFSIPKSYYIPEGNIRLLSPQHWAQTRPGNDKLGTGEDTNAHTTTLYWNDKSSKRTVPLDRDGSNVATFRLSPGFAKFHAYCAETGSDPSPQREMDPLTVNDMRAVKPDYIPDEGEDDTNTENVPEADPDPGWEHSELPSKHTEINLNPSTPEGGVEPPQVITDEEDRVKETPVAELLRLHYNFGHTPFSKLQQMAKRGVLPSRLAKCYIPICSACQYAKATKRKWRPKTSKNYKPFKATAPGQVVSVDQLVSPTPGLIAQMSGFITDKRYKYATVFVDQFSGMGYIYLQKEASVEETLEAKKAFERYALSMGVIIRAYHADNGVFKAKGWINECHTKEQGMTYAAVGAHHTNGKAERRIRELQEMARTSLIHANRRWPGAIEAYLWPYAVRYACDCINNTPNLQDPQRKSPYQLFSGSDVEVNPKHWMPFGAPAYVLKEAPRDDKPFHKWASKARLAIYLGRSPLHNKQVALVMDRTTGYVSPQFHVKIDTGFYTLRQETISTRWQYATKFRHQPDFTPTSRKRKRKGKSTHPEGEEGLLSHNNDLHLPQEQDEGPLEPDGALPEQVERGLTGPDEQQQQVPASDGMEFLGTPAIPIAPPGARRSARERTRVERETKLRHECRDIQPNWTLCSWRDFLLLRTLPQG